MRRTIKEFEKTTLFIGCLYIFIFVAGLALMDDWYSVFAYLINTLVLLQLMKNLSVLAIMRREKK